MERRLQKSAGTTITEIARQAGCAPSTVSRALQDHPRIGAAMKRKIMEISERLNYTPNPLALALLRGRDDMVGFIVPDVLNPVYSILFYLLEKSLGEHGIRVIMADSDRDAGREVSLIETFTARKVAGIVIVPVSDVDRSVPEARYQNLVQGSIPCVLLGPARQLPHVCGDDSQSAQELARHLIDQGCRGLLYIASHGAGTVFSERVKVLKAELAKAGLKLHVLDKSSPEEVVASVPEWLARHPEVDAVVCEDVLSAIGTSSRLLHSGVSIPGDCMVAVMDHYPSPDIVAPQLTHLAVPYEEIITHVVSQFLARLETPNAKFQSRTFSAPLQIRGSTTRFPR